MPFSIYPIKRPIKRQPSPPSADRLIAANSALFGRVAKRVQIWPCGGGRRVNDSLLPRAVTNVGHIDLEQFRGTEQLIGDIWLMTRPPAVATEPFSPPVWLSRKTNYEFSATRTASLR